MGGLGALRPLDGSQAQQDRRERLARLVMELPREPAPLDLLGLHRPPQGVPLHAARVLDRHRRLRRKEHHGLLVLLGEASLRLLLGQVEVPEGDAARHDRDAEEAVHRRMVRRKADRARVTGEVVQAERPRFLDQDTQDPEPARDGSDCRPSPIVEPVGDEPLQAAAGAIDHAERRIAGPGQLGGDPDERLEDGVEGQLRGDRNAGLDERAPSVVAVHEDIQPVRDAPRRRLQANFTVMPPVPKPKAAKTGRNRNLLIALGVAGDRRAGADRRQHRALAGRRWGRHRDVDLPVGSTSAPVALVAGIPQSGMVLGNPAAKVRMLQWEDIQCPVCKVYTDEALPAIVDEYVRPGKVKLDFRGLAFLGPDSVKALRISLAAGLQNKLWEVVGLFFENQGAENSGWVTDELVDEILAEVPGLDADKVKADADSATVTDQIEAAQAEATRLEVNGTPSFFIGVGEEPLYQIQPRDFIPSEFRPALDDALAP